MKNQSGFFFIEHFKSPCPVVPVLRLFSIFCVVHVVLWSTYILYKLGHESIRQVTQYTKHYMLLSYCATPLSCSKPLLFHAIDSLTLGPSFFYLLEILSNRLTIGGMIQA